MSESPRIFDAVVIGSGFGGAIAALRLAQAGKSVLVLERGKRYRPGEFPREVTDIDRLFWRYPETATAQGLYELRFFSDIATVTASGVGGGSLIYANIHVRPDATVFEDPRWPAAIDLPTLSPYYDKVAAMLDITPVPPALDLAKRNVFRAAAEHLGHECFDPDQAVSWTDSGGAGRKACQLCSQCEFGCQFGAKNTLDFNYLAQAETLGTRIEAGQSVSHIAPDEQGYRVFYRDIANATDHEVIGHRVVLCAGTLGSNAILLHSRDGIGTLPNLSSRLGYGYSANGDFLGTIQNSRFDLEPGQGPDVTSVMRFPHSAAPFTLAAPRFNRETMAVLASFGQPTGGFLPFMAAPAWDRLNELIPWLFKRGMFSRPSPLPAPNAGDAKHMTNLFAIGRDNANGVVKLKNGKVDIQWRFAEENRALIDRMEQQLKRLADYYGGTFAALPLWTIFTKILTVHSLGGCALSESPVSGVVSPNGEVHGYPGLFVADGSVVPAAIGYHPVMTISALAELIAESVVASYGN